MLAFRKSLQTEGNGISYPTNGMLAIVEYTCWVYDNTQSENRGEM
jgi:hypothetical protein